MFNNKVICVLPVVVLVLLTVAPVLLPVYGEAHRMSDGSDRACPVCPYFINTPTNVTAPQGMSANLTCGVRNLSDRKVSWIRRRDLHVLTTGAFTYTTDVRFRVLHLEGSPYWTLEVGSPTINDSGVYECQVSTQPKIFRRFTLNVIVPRAEITGTQQIFMKAGSDINITCVVAGAVRGASVKWYHVLPQPRNGVSTIEINIGERGGVQLVTDKNEGTSWLLVTHATWKDAGNYTCAPAYARPASVSVHVLDEETPAAMQHDLLQPTSGSQRLSPVPPGFLLVSVALIQALLLLLLFCPWGGAATDDDGSAAAASSGGGGGRLIDSRVGDGGADSSVLLAAAASAAAKGVLPAAVLAFTSLWGGGSMGAPVAPRHTTRAATTMKKQSSPSSAFFSLPFFDVYIPGLSPRQQQSLKQSL
ncbi:uncharacterized protein [Macrobrachium rosenbergii]|uniref:uncharacterized protein isoform X2 n=1 Tax=Macrobrachium rosenbergii TaxID=79674 RepID=UPI0034D3EA1E